MKQTESVSGRSPKRLRPPSSVGGQILDDVVRASPNVTMVNFPTYEGQCDQPFTAVNGGRCYFPSYDLVKTTWKEAQVICSWLHPKGQLAEFETLQEIVDATGFLINDNSTHGWGSVGPWIGAIEKGDSNTFIWHSSKAPIEAHNWAESRPYSTTSGDGVALDASDNFQWIDLSSGTYLPFLCEIPSNPRPDESEDKTEELERRLREVEEALRKVFKDIDEAEKKSDAQTRQLEELAKRFPCPIGFLLVGNSCYAVFDKDSDKRSWDAAQAFCRAKAAGGHLVELETKAEIALLKTHMKGNDYYRGSGCNYWIGGEEIGASNAFVWASTGQHIGDSDWSPSEPNNSGSGDAIIVPCYSTAPGIREPFGPCKPPCSSQSTRELP
ncbi:unnamed protein product [Cyprideis torosa]|uniref:Uncharacterized protein n=1 Tax=Cyprideis torosa TaxID=163714 RepID=A0A7R8WBR0_9CRUS|nr:unnamed protein product [Cyprideis torosa]CAG0892553.1 unnamed protein product [Cyprideis torosa]